MDELVLRVAAKAVIVNGQGEVLILREASTYVEGTHHGRYDCPGGRLELGERYEDGLRREVREEAGLDIEPLYPIYQGEWRPIINGVPHQIIGLFTVCRATSCEVTLSHEHDDFQWINPIEHSNFNLMEPVDAVINRFATWYSNLVFP